MDTPNSPAEMSLSMGPPNQIVASETLIELGEQDKNVIVVTSDSRGSGKLVPFGEKFPEQIVEVGIAEQTLVGVAAGLASTGKKVFAVSPACFLTARSLEQIKNDICYSDNPVNLIGISAGVSYGALGSTHHSIHDFAVLRAINNITIVAPADSLESRQAILAACASPHPFYIRLGKSNMPRIHDEGTEFIIGKAIKIKDGVDVAIIATGETVCRAVEASVELETLGYSCRVLSMHTVKPLDTDAVLQAGKECRALITMEEHMVNGGLGEACASLLMQVGISKPFRMLAIPDEYTVSGSQSEILDHYGISSPNVVKLAKELLDA